MLENVLFVEKYRPKTLDGIVGNFKTKLRNYLKMPNSMPSFIFYSRSPGTGKTTLAKAIINELGCDYIMLNSSDDRKLDVVREKIKVFVRSQSSKKGVKKCVFLDEFDGMLSPTQNALRNVIEQYSSNAFFILTCNSIERIIEPIQSRCVTIDFNKPDKSEIIKRLKDICRLESISATDNELVELVRQEYPSIRNMLIILQDAKLTNISLKELGISKHKKYLKIWDLIKTGKMQDLKQIVYQHEVDICDFNDWIFRVIFAEVFQGISYEKGFKIAELAADNEKSFGIGLNRDIIFLANCQQMYRIIND